MMDSLLRSSSSFLTMSSIVREALECEKELTRGWLRSEMNSLVDPLIESLFGKFADKLTTFLLDSNATSTYSSSYHHHHLNPIATSTSISQSSSNLSKLPETFEEQVEVECEEVDEDEECDCDDCLNGEIIDVVNGEEGYHDDDEVQVIDDDEPSKPKRPRLDPAVRVNHHATVENQIIAHSLKCLQVDCYKMFVNKNQMYEHLKLVHTIGRYRCLVKDCHGSFDRNCDLGQHMKDVHSQLAKFACSQCSKNFRTYHLLFKHKSNLHFLGHFQCSFPSCTFVDKTRVRVFGHYSRAHKYSLVCSQCPYRTLNATKLKAHERGHAGIEPYRCKWPGCSGYAHASRDAALAHIRSVHLNAKKMGLLYGQGATAVAADPRDYLEVVKELIN